MISLGGLSAVPGAYQLAQANMFKNLQSQQDQQTWAGLANIGQGPISTTPQLPTTLAQLNMPQQSALPQVAPSNPLIDALKARGGQNVQPSTQNAPYGAPSDQGAAGGDMASWKNAISQNESGGDYSLLGPKQSDGDYAVGKYQVMASNVGPWTQEILGQAMTPDQFRASPQAQEAVFEGKFGQYVKEKGSPQGAALAWFAGPGGTMSSGPDSLGTTPASYVAQFNAGLGKGGGAGAGGVRLPDTSQVVPGTLTWASAVNAARAANPKASPAVIAMVANKLVPLMQADQAQQWKQIDEQRQNFEAETSRISATKAPTSTAAAGDVGDIVQAIKDGRMPHPGAVGTSRFYPVAMNAQISRELAKDTTYNTSAHIIDWNAMSRATATQNSPVTTRIVGAIGSARAFLDTFQKNLDAWNAAGLPTIVNQQILDKASAGLLPGVDQKQAALIKSQYGELVTLLASVFQAGGVPTSSATQLAKEQIDLGWSRGTIDAVIDQINNNLDSREAAIRGVQPFTPGSTGPNTYSQGGGQPAPTQAQPAPASNIPAGGTPVPPNGFTDAGQPPQSYLSQGGTADDWKYVPPEQRKFFP
jgi:hypothetical protein